MLLLLSLFGFYAKTEEKGNPCCHLWAKFRLQQERKEMLPEDVTEGEKKRQKKTEIKQAIIINLDNRRTIHFGSIPYIFPSLLLPSPQ